MVNPSSFDAPLHVPCELPSENQILRSDRRRRAKEQHAEPHHVGKKTDDRSQHGPHVHTMPDSAADSRRFRSATPRRQFLRGTKKSLSSVDLFRCEPILLQSFWVLVAMDVFTRRIIGFGLAREHIDGVIVCRMFNQAAAGRPRPTPLPTAPRPPERYRSVRLNRDPSKPNIDQPDGVIPRELRAYPHNCADLGHRRRHDAAISEKHAILHGKSGQ